MQGMQDRYVLYAQSEFGRRAAENGSGGTDHGSGGLMMVMGQGVQGGRVHGTWPTLAPTALTKATCGWKRTTAMCWSRFSRPALGDRPRPCVRGARADARGRGAVSPTPGVRW